ncbi:hypothetical protein [Streptomyces sp. 3214.6]|uniref:hypothetical protein n=1 Tax=Streptomyces sp. 3214.6 TaxID=1882757 RepID=UPI0009A6D779|nr:hypothetical protein [Streptomyces sp. 3214.6]
MSLLNWNSSQHYDPNDKPCTQCDGPTNLRSHNGEVVHKVCAEDWNDCNATAPRFEHEGRDLGTTQFHSDLPRKNRDEGTA